MLSLINCFLRSNLKPVTLCVLTFLATAHPSIHAQSQPHVKLDYKKPQPVIDELLDFAARNHLKLISPATHLLGYKTPVASGTFTFAAALKLILKNTPYQATLKNGNTIIFEKKAGQFIERPVKKSSLDVSFLMEEVTTTGFRRALLDARSLKDNAINLQEIVTEMDIGKMPDDSIPNTLKRLSGIQINQRPALGSTIRIRGMDQNQLLYHEEPILNGLENFQLGRLSDEISHAYDLIPVDLVQRIEVHKTPLSTLPSGGAGGTINLVGRQFTPRDRSIFKMEVMGSYHDAHRETKPSANVILGKQWGKSFSALFSINHQSLFRQQDYIDLYELTVATQSNTTGQLPVPELSTVMDKRFDVEHTTTALDLTGIINDIWSTSFHWLGFHSHIDSSEYTLQHFLSEYDETTLTAPTKLPSFGYNAGLPSATSGMGESINTQAHNLMHKNHVVFNEEWQLETRTTYATAKFKQDAGIAGGVNIQNYQQLEKFAGGFGNFSQWISTNNLPCDTACIQNLFSNLPEEQQPRLSNSNDPDFSFDNYVAGNFRAFASHSEQDRYTFNLNVTFEPSATNTWHFGGRTSHTSTMFNDYRYASDLSLSPIESIPQLYDLCDNGGIPERERCDIDGDAQNDNLPFGSLLVELDVSRAIQFAGLDFSLPQTEQPAPNPSSEAAALFGEYISLIPVLPLVTQGLRPWFPYGETQEPFIVLDNFFTSGHYQDIRLFPNPNKIRENVHAWYDALLPDAPGARYFIPAESWSIDEKRHALFFSGSQSINTNLEWDFGLRWVNIQRKIQHYELSEAPRYSLSLTPWYVDGISPAWVPVVSHQDTHDLLGHGIAKWQLNTDIILRAGISRSLGDPKLQDIGKSTTPIFNSNFRGFSDSGLYLNGGYAGNRDLTQTKVDAIDLSADWHLTTNSQLSAALFHKKVHDFHGLNTTLEAWSSNAVLAPEKRPITRRENLGKAELNGLELAVQHHWKSGLGVDVNYANIKSYSAINARHHNNLGFPGVSEHSLNTSLIFETTLISARLIYLWNSEYISPERQRIQYANNDGDPRTLTHIVDHYDQLDFKLIGYINDQFTLSFEAINVLENHLTSYFETPALPATYRANGRYFQVGIKLSL